jgi:hypothetical protein
MGPEELHAIRADQRTWHPVIQRECVEINEEEANRLLKHEAFLRVHMQDNKANL